MGPSPGIPGTDALAARSRPMPVFWRNRVAVGLTGV